MFGESDKMEYYVSASVLSADMLHLEQEIRKMENSGIDMLHFDVMDGIFVNNISYGLPILESVNKCTDMFLDVHLMITDPLKYVKRFADYQSHKGMRCKGIRFHQARNSCGSCF